MIEKLKGWFKKPKAKSKLELVSIKNEMLAYLDLRDWSTGDFLNNPENFHEGSVYERTEHNVRTNIRAQYAQLMIEYSPKANKKEVIRYGAAKIAEALKALHSNKLIEKIAILYPCIMDLTSIDTETNTHIHPNDYSEAVVGPALHNGPGWKADKRFVKHRILFLLYFIPTLTNKWSESKQLLTSVMECNEDRALRNICFCDEGELARKSITYN